MLISLKNAYLAKRREVIIPFSKVKLELAKILAKEGFIEDFKKSKNSIVVTLKFTKREPALRHIKIVSKPGMRVYTSRKKLPNIMGGFFGTAIISTPQGLVTSQQARKKGLGGEIICEIW